MKENLTKSRTEYNYGLDRFLSTVPLKGGTVKRVLIALVILVIVGYATPLELEGGALYIEVTDTTLTFEAPDDGMIFVGYILRGEAMGKGVNLIMDNDTLMYTTTPDGGAGANSESNTLATSISKGNHIIMVKKPLGSPTVITHSRIWILFWPKKSLTVAEPGEEPGIPPISFLASFCKAGTPIQVSLPSSVIYDASGRLIERPGTSWTPTEAGTYFVKTEKQTQKIIIVK